MSDRQFILGHGTWPSYRAMRMIAPGKAGLTQESRSMSCCSPSADAAMIDRSRTANDELLLASHDIGGGMRQNDLSVPTILRWLHPDDEKVLDTLPGDCDIVPLSPRDPLQHTEHARRHIDRNAEGGWIRSASLRFAAKKKTTPWA